MNYKRIYGSLMIRAAGRKLEGYVERHHIVPRCMGGGDEASNIAVLTPEEHYVAHQLLVKMYPGGRKLIYALAMMTGKRGARIRNKRYGWIMMLVRSCPGPNTGKKCSPELIAKILKGLHSKESQKKAALSRIGRKQSPEHIERRVSQLRDRIYGPHTEEHKANISTALLGKKKSIVHAQAQCLARRGQKRSIESRMRMRASRLAFIDRNRAPARCPAGGEHHVSI